MNAPANIGHNSPPPFDAISLHIEDLLETAKGFLDGEPITTQAMADEVGKLLAAAREAEKAAEEQRRIEAKPFDDGKAEVQARYNPLKAKCALAQDTAKRALAPYLAAEQARKDAEAAEARRVADAKAAEAQAAMRAAAATDLAAREEAERLLKEANRADRDANRASKGKAMAAGGARSVSLRKVWIPTLTDAAAALKHYRAAQPEALKSWLIEQANADVRGGARSIPGFTISDEQVAQ
jgi:hypothetical protein